MVDVPARLLHQYFQRESRDSDSSFRAKPSLRELITFRQINLQNSEWPINTVFDVIFCRNVMIYFDSPSQKKIVNHFAEHLADDGYLMIGHSESLFGLTDLFKPLGETIYGRNLTHSIPGKALTGDATQSSGPQVRRVAPFKQLIQPSAVKPNQCPPAH